MSDAPRALPAPAAPSGSASVGVLSLVALGAGALPFPFLPGVVLRRVRGALIHDIADRHGLSLTEEARQEISEPSRTSQKGAFLATAAFLARRTLRRFGILGVIPPLSAWLEVYSLGLLFQRYLDRTRASRTLRIHDVEARRIRRAIDRAISRALSLQLELPPRRSSSAPAEELRDLPTRLVDGVLLAAAALPEHLKRRLETAFDQALDEDPLEV